MNPAHNKEMFLPRSKELTDSVDPFKILDAVGSQIKKLSLLVYDDDTLSQYLFLSNQSEYIEQIDVYIAIIDSICLVKDMATLTTFNISQHDLSLPPLRLVNCLNVCPTILKHLQIYFTHSIIDPFNIVLDSIETLDITLNELTSGLGEIISSYFSNLITLKFTGDLIENANKALNGPRFQNVIFDT
ncbi:hypothetical protein K501DRAFT_268218 [Backusella circina FSU 941]|nr:hypothetical protein K501DRAFT_268218 [Backusella circina FSU 941]